MTDYNNPRNVPVEEKATGGFRVPGAAKILKNFFGFAEGQKLTEFATEVNTLSVQDQIDLVGGIEDGTLDY